MGDKTHKIESQDPPASEEARPAYEVTVNKATNEIAIKDPATGQTVRLHGTMDVDTHEDEEEELRPLTPAQFRAAIQALDALGLTWTADGIPSIKRKENQKQEESDDEELGKLQREYPHLPSELSYVIAHAITGVKVPSSRAGNDEDLAAKVAIVRELLITPEFKAEFFFKHSIKLPYFAGMDWEIVFKLVENNVAKPPGISYALLSLVYHYPSVVGACQRL